MGCCRIFADEPCNDMFPTECLGYVPCDVLDDKEDHDEDISFLKELCTFEYVKTKEGRLQCSSMCQIAQCCFDDSMQCSPEIQEVCDDYEPCTILDIVSEAIANSENHQNTLTLVQQNLQSSIINACSQESMNFNEGRMLCEKLCTPAKCCFNHDITCDDEEEEDFIKSSYCLPYTKCAA